MARALQLHTERPLRAETDFCGSAHAPAMVSEPGPDAEVLVLPAGSTGGGDH